MAFSPGVNAVPASNWFSGLTRPTHADKLSAMKTFTVRELDREPSAVLDVCDREGVVRVRRRDGRLYLIRPEAGPEQIPSLPDFRARIAKVFPKALSAEQTRRVDKLLAGE